MGKFKGGSGEGGINIIINKMIFFLKSINNIFVPLLIIVLFIAILIIQLNHFSDFVKSRWKKYTSTIKTNSPYNESLNISHCNINNIGDTVYNETIWNLFMIFTILFILFWYNYITGFFSKTRIENEIKIIGYDKYYNTNITNKNEYSIINMLSIYIFITFIYYGYMMYDSYVGNNYNEIEIYKNIKLIDKTIQDNIICKLYNDIINANKNGKPINDILKEFFETNANANGDADIVGYNNKTDGGIQQRLKIIITCALATDISFIKINEEDNICGTDLNTNNLKCIYKKFYNVKNNKIFPDFNDINLINVISNPTYLLNQGETSENITQLLKLDINRLKAEYDKIQNNITNYSREINKNRESNILYYKFGLMFATVSSLLFSVLATLYFVFFEFLPLNKFVNNGVYIGVDYYIKNYYNIAIIYVVALLIILFAFIINF